MSYRSEGKGDQPHRHEAGSRLLAQPTQTTRQMVGSWLGAGAALETDPLRACGFRDEISSRNPLRTSPSRPDRIAYAVGGYITAAYWFTSSTSFANPAVTIARMFSDTFAGIAPSSVPPFLLAQIVGGAIGYALVRTIYPRTIPIPNNENDHDRQPARSATDHT